MYGTCQWTFGGPLSLSILELEPEVAMGVSDSSGRILGTLAAAGTRVVLVLLALFVFVTAAAFLPSGEGHAVSQNNEREWSDTWLQVLVESPDK